MPGPLKLKYVCRDLLPLYVVQNASSPPMQEDHLIAQAREGMI